MTSFDELPDQVKEDAEVVWDYLLMGYDVDQSDVSADAIFALGSHDLSVAERAAVRKTTTVVLEQDALFSHCMLPARQDLFLAGKAPLLIVSGGYGRLTAGINTKAEAVLFAEVAVMRGVPADAILVEPKSTNTGENIRFTEALLKERGCDATINTFILVQKPYMERRTFATFRKQWPQKNIVAVTSPCTSFVEYARRSQIIPLLNTMIGDLHRIRVYPQKGFQIDMDIPAEVWEGFERLVAAGYNRDLVKT